jgi:hypothetical protein
MRVKAVFKEIAASAPALLQQLPQANKAIAMQAASS